MPTVSLSRESFDDASNIIIQFLHDAGYNGSLEDGTGLHDIVVKPNALLRNLFTQLVTRATAYQSLQKATELRSEIGEDEYNAAVDCILSNWFVSRHDGKPSTGLLRLWFLQPPDFIYFHDGDSLGSVDNTPVVADGDQVFVPDNFAFIVNTTENTNEYYIDVAVRTESNSTIQPSDTSGSSVSYTYEDMYFLRTTISGEFTPGSLAESSADFINRTRQVITTRELITASAINTVLMENFEDIIRLYVARHGSREQLRDVVDFEGASVHTGNMADIYLATKPVRIKTTVNADLDGIIDTSQLPETTTVITFIQAAKEDDGTLLDLHVECDEKTWCSPRESVSLIKVDAVGKVVLEMLADTVIAKVNNFVYSSSQRVVCYDPLVKHMFPLMIYLDLNVELVRKNQNSDKAIQNAVLAYVDYIVKFSQPWVTSELIATIHKRVPNVKKILLPLGCTGKLYDPRTNHQLQMELGSSFTIETCLKDAHSLQITDNTVQFYCDRQSINIVSDYKG